MAISYQEFLTKSGEIRKDNQQGQFRTGALVGVGSLLSLATGSEYIMAKFGMGSMSNFEYFGLGVGLIAFGYGLYKFYNRSGIVRATDFADKQVMENGVPDYIVTPEAVSSYIGTIARTLRHDEAAQSRVLAKYNNHHTGKY